MVTAERVRQRLWNGARKEPVRALKGWLGSKKIVFLYDRSHQLVENKGQHFPKTCKTNLTGAQIECLMRTLRAQFELFNVAHVSGRGGMRSVRDCPAGGDLEAREKMKKSGNESKEYLKTKDTTF